MSRQDGFCANSECGCYIFCTRVLDNDGYVYVSDKNDDEEAWFPCLKHTTKEVSYEQL